MGSQQRLKRSYIENDGAFEGQQYQLSLPRNYDVETYRLRVTGNAVVTTSFPSTRVESPFGLVRRIEIIADGRSTLVSQSGTTACYPMQLRTPPLTPGINGARIVPSNIAGTNPFSMVFELPRAMFDGLRPKDSNFRTNAPNTIDLRISFGNCADMFNGAGVGTISNLQVTVFADEISEAKDRAGNISAPMYLIRYNEVQVPAVSNNTALQIKLPVNTILRGCFFRQSVNGEPTDSIINRIQLKRGLDVRASRAARDLRYENFLQQGYAPFTGTLNLDLAKTPGYLVKTTDCWNLDGSTDAYAELDITGQAGGLIQMLTTELVRIRR